MGTGQTPNTADLNNAFRPPWKLHRNAGGHGKAPSYIRERPSHLTGRRNKHSRPKGVGPLQNDEHVVAGKKTLSAYQGLVVEEAPATPGMEGFGGTLPADAPAIVQENCRSATPYASNSKGQKEDLRQPPKVQQPEHTVEGKSRPSTYKCPTIQSAPPTPGMEGFGGTLPAGGSATIEDNRRTTIPYPKYSMGQKEDLQKPVKLQKPKPKPKPRVRR